MGSRGAHVHFALKTCGISEVWGEGRVRNPGATGAAPGRQSDYFHLVLKNCGISSDVALKSRSFE